MDLVREEFLQRVDFYQRSWLPARALVEEALAQRFQVQAWEEALWFTDYDCWPAAGRRGLPLPATPPFRWTQVER